MISVAYVNIIYPSSGIYCIYIYIPELKKNVPSSIPGQEDFLAEQVTFKALLPGPGESCSKK